MPQIAFCFPAADRMLLFQKDRQNGALQGKQKKRSHMDNVDSAVDDLSTAQVNTGDYPVDRKDKETILPAKPACLTGKHTERLLQIRVTGQQRTDGGVQAEDRKTNREQIQSLKSAKQQRKQAGYPAETRCIDKITLVRHQIARQVGEHAPSTACIPDSFLCGGSNVKIIGVRMSQVQRPDQQRLGNQSMRSQNQYIGKDEASVIKGKHHHPLHGLPVPPSHKLLPHDAGSKKAEVR